MTRKPVGTVRRALNQTVKAMRDLGRLEPVDDALVALCGAAADAVDFRASAGAVKEYRECLKQLSEVGVDGGDSDLDQLLAALQSSVGDETEPEQTEPAS